MVSDYKNANGDYRGVLERYLPTAYKTIGNGSDVHRGLLGALKQMLVTTEQDIIEGTKQVFLANANSWALDLYGDWVGESRKGELDDAYRARIIEKITLGRNTVGNIIAGIKREVNDPDLTVSVYEPWRNIFILNKSLLNGADKLMGNFYRYAVIQITLNKYVNALELQVIADKYKSAGVSVVFVYRDGIVAGDGTLLALPLRLINEGRNTVNQNRSQLYGSLLMNGLPTGAKSTDLFTVNESDINGNDVLASDPNSLYSNAYGTVPSKNIFGTTASNASMTSDPFDFVYQQSKVDMSTVGGRNLVLNSATPHIGAGNNTSNQIIYPLTHPMSVKTGDLFAQFGLHSYLTISFDWTISGATTTGSFFPQFNAPLYGFSAPAILVNDSNTSGHFTYTWWMSADYSGSTSSDIQFRADYLQGKLTIANLKLEKGAVSTPWTPAPEDTPKIYIHPYTGTDYTSLNRLDGVTETVTASGLPTVAFNISEYVKGVLKDKALDDATFSGRNLLLGSKDYTGQGWTLVGESRPLIPNAVGNLTAHQSQGAWTGPKYKVTDLSGRGIINETDSYTLSAWVNNTGTSSVSIYFYGDNVPTSNTKLVTLPASSGWVRVSTKKFRFDLTTTPPSGTIRFEPTSSVVGGVIQTAGLLLEKVDPSPLRNWFSKSNLTPGWMGNGVVVSDVATDESASSWYIPVTPGTGSAVAQVWYDKPLPTTSAFFQNYMRVAFFDSNYGYLTRTPVQATWDTTYQRFRIDTPANTAYIRVSFSYINDGYGHVMITSGPDTPKDFVPALEDLPWVSAPEDNPTSVDYTNFSTPVSSININLKGSPFGLAPTTINVLSQGGTPLTGKWYKNGTLISPQIPQVSDPVTPTGTWSFKLDTPTLVSSVTITDNYPDSTGSYRVITMSTTDNRELVLLNTTQQVTGTINTARLQTQTPEIYRPYIKSATIGDTTLTSPQVFDATTGHWIDITSTTELVPYITYGDITDSLYLTLRNKTAQQKIDYLGLNVTQVSVEGQ